MNNFERIGAGIERMREKNRSKLLEICPECGELKYKNVNEWPVPCCPCYQKMVEEEERWRIAQEEAASPFRAAFARVNEINRNNSFENYEAAAVNEVAVSQCEKWARKFRPGVNWKNKTGLTIVGPVGTGKTHLAVSIMRVALQRGIRCFFGRMPDIMAEIGRRIEDKERGDLTERFKSVDLLIIDDMDKAYVTSWLIDKTFDIVDHRAGNFKPMVITTNLPLQKLVGIFSLPTIDRIGGVCYNIPILGESYRKKGG